MSKQYVVGQRVGAFVVGARAGRMYQVTCCVCGKESLKDSGNIRRDKSCGCARYSNIAETLTRHGGSNTPTWKSWASMIDRCTKPKTKCWPNYGGRGITVCDRWRKFDAFLEDMGWKPDGTSLDRIDNNGNYEPGNCRWATSIEQANNKRNNDVFEYAGERLTIPAWSRRTGIKPGSLRTRLYKLKWPIERALTQPVVSRRYWLEGAQ